MGVPIKQGQFMPTPSKTLQLDLELEKGVRECVRISDSRTFNPDRYQRKIIINVTG